MAGKIDYGFLMVSYILGIIGVRVWFMLFFFFQAEDGIRDYKVTGVQTCALPIWAGALLLNLDPATNESKAAAAVAHAMPVGSGMGNGRLDLVQALQSVAPANGNKIGRASCRERV